MNRFNTEQQGTTTRGPGTRDSKADASASVYLDERVEPTATNPTGGSADKVGPSRLEGGAVHNPYVKFTMLRNTILTEFSLFFGFDQQLA